MQPSNKLPPMTTGTFILSIKRTRCKKMEEACDRPKSFVTKLRPKFFSARCCGVAADIWRVDKKPLSGQTPNPPSSHQSILVHHKLQQHKLSTTSFNTCPPQVAATQAYISIWSASPSHFQLELGLIIFKTLRIKGIVHQYFSFVQISYFG